MVNAIYVDHSSACKDYTAMRRGKNQKVHIKQSGSFTTEIGVSVNSTSCRQQMRCIHQSHQIFSTQRPSCPR